MVGAEVQGAVKNASAALAAAAPACTLTAAFCLSIEAIMASMEAACLLVGGVVLGVEALAAGLAACAPCRCRAPNKIQAASCIRFHRCFGKNAFGVRYVLCKKLMATYNPFVAYLESKVLSASPLELISLAYEGAVDAVGSARVHLVEKRIHERSQAITKAQMIIRHLQESLDFERGGDLSPQLSRLYDYMTRRLTDANFQQAEAPLVEVENLLGTLLESWRELAKLEKPVTAFAAASNSSSWMTPNDSLSYSLTDLTL